MELAESALAEVMLKPDNANMLNAISLIATTSKPARCG
jgi:hypothetical protein